MARVGTSRLHEMICPCFPCSKESGWVRNCEPSMELQSAFVMVVNDATLRRSEQTTALYATVRKCFRGYDNASSVDEKPKSPRNVRASVSERVDITRDHTTNHTTTGTSNNTILTRFQCGETLVFKRQAKASSHARVAPANSHTRPVVLCYRTLPKHTW